MAAFFFAPPAPVRAVVICLICFAVRVVAGSVESRHTPINGVLLTDNVCGRALQSCPPPCFPRSSLFLCRSVCLSLSLSLSLSVSLSLSLSVALSFCWSLLIFCWCRGLQIYYTGGNGPFMGSRAAGFSLATLQRDWWFGFTPTKTAAKAGRAWVAHIVTTPVTVGAAGMVLVSADARYVLQCKTLDAPTCMHAHSSRRPPGPGAVRTLPAGLVCVRETSCAAVPACPLAFCARPCLRYGCLYTGRVSRGVGDNHASDGKRVQARRCHRWRRGGPAPTHRQLPGSPRQPDRRGRGLGACEEDALGVC